MVGQTKKIKIMKELLNIPANSLQVLSSNKKEERVTMSYFSEGEIRLSGFAMMQFLHGAKLELEETEKEPTRNELTLWFKISTHLLPITGKLSEVALAVDRQDLFILRKWLEVRMLHCEMERDTRSDKFNPDTYIGQKLLLLDLRELLLGEAVDSLKKKY